MNEKYKQELVTWGIRTAASIALTVMCALIFRWLGVTVESPPPPPMNVIVETKPGLFGGPTDVRIERAD